MGVISNRKDIKEILGVESKEDAFKIIESMVFKDVSSKDSEMNVIVNICESYNLNPTLGHLYIKRDEQGYMFPTLTVDGWYKLINEHPDFDGCEFEESNHQIEVPKVDKDSTTIYCFDKIGCRIYRKGRSKTPTVYEYLTECFNYFNGAWFTHPKRLLRHKAFIQAARVVFNLSGIYDPEEVNAIIEKQQPGENTAFEVVGQAEKKAEALDEDIVDVKNQQETTEVKLEHIDIDSDVLDVPEVAEKASDGMEETEPKTNDLEETIKPPYHVVAMVEQYINNAKLSGEVDECVTHLKGRIDEEYHQYIELTANK